MERIFDEGDVMKMNRKLLVPVAACIVLFTVGIALWPAKPAEKPRSPEPENPNLVEMPVEAQRNAGLSVVKAGASRIERQIKITGIVSPDRTRMAHISPIGQGLVEKIFVRLGDHVKKGQPLLRYDNIELGEMISEHLAAHSDLERAKAQQVVAKKSLERAQNLIKLEAISPRDYELRQAQEKQAEAEVIAREAQVSKSEEKLHRFGLTEEQVRQITQGGASHRTASDNLIRAPLAGIITRYDVAEGEVVGRQKELFTIVDPSDVWVLGDIYEKELGHVPEKGDCLVSVSAYPGVQFRGRIDYISDFLDPASRTAKLRCVVANDGRLKLEMFGEVIIPTRETDSVLSVPAAAVQEVNGEPVVFVPRDKTHFEKRPVKLGEKGESAVQVLEGLKAGDSVVAEGSFYLKTALLRESLGEQD